MGVTFNKSRYDQFAMKRNLPESLQGENYKWLREMVESCKEFAMIEHAASQMGGEPPLEDTTDYSEDNNPPY